MSEQPDAIDLLVGIRMRALRLERGMSQGQLGDALHISFQQVQKYERGSNRISASRLWHASKVLGVDPSYFFKDVPDDFAKGAVPKSMTDFLASHYGQEWHRLGARLPQPALQALICTAKVMAGDVPGS